MGKGSAPRPFSVSHDEFSNNFDAIFGKKRQTSQERICPRCAADLTKRTQFKSDYEREMVLRVTRWCCESCGYKDDDVEEDVEVS